MFLSIRYICFLAGRIDLACHRNLKVLHFVTILHQETRLHLEHMVSSLVAPKVQQIELDFLTFRVDDEEDAFLTWYDFAGLDRVLKGQEFSSLRKVKIVVNTPHMVEAIRNALTNSLH
jgi:hypothetical protein